MKRFLILFFLSFFTALHAGNLYPSIQVSGAGVPSVNGRYVFESLVSGYPRYEKDNDPNLRIARDMFGYWGLQSVSPAVGYYGSTDPLEGEWVSVTGAAPVPISSPLSPTIDGGDVVDVSSKRVWDCGAVGGGTFIAVGTPTVELRALGGSTSTVVVEDRSYLRTVGLGQVTDFRWSWTLNPTRPGTTVTRGTSNASVIIPNPSDPTLWTYVGAGNATITIQSGSSPLYSKAITTYTSGAGTSDVLTGYVAGSLRKHVTDTIDSQLAGKTPEANLAIFSSRNTSTGVYTRNINVWTSVDMTGATANNWGGHVIAPDVVIFSAHAHAGVNSTLHFVTSDNQTISRTITAGYTAPGYTPHHPDWWLAKLNSPLPASIKPAKFFPSNIATYLPSLNSQTSIPSIGHNQFREATVQNLVYLSEGAKPMTGTHSPQDPQRLKFFKAKIGGDSSSPLIVPVNGEPVIATVWTYGGSGGGTSLTSQRAAIDTGMTALGSSYQTVSVTLSGFNTYP